MPPQDSLHYLRDSIALAHLIEDVPEAVRNSFGRVRKTYLYGLVEYELFTVADDDARLILEGALRARFLTYYDGQVPVTKKGEETMLNTSSFDDVREADKRKYQLRTGDGPRRLPISMASLLRWARRERLLVGQRSTITDQTAVDLRHHVAHPSGYHLLGPVDAARTLCRVAEYINKLWGADTPGGRAFPAPVVRVPRVAAIAADGSCVTFPSVRSVREGDPSVQDGTFAVYLVSPQEELYGIGGPMLDWTSATGPAFNARACRASCCGVPDRWPTSCRISTATKTGPSTTGCSTSTGCSSSVSTARRSTQRARQRTSRPRTRPRANGTCSAPTTRTTLSGTCASIATRHRPSYMMATAQTVPSPRSEDSSTAPPQPSAFSRPVLTEDSRQEPRVVPRTRQAPCMSYNTHDRGRKLRRAPGRRTVTCSNVSVARVANDPRWPSVASNLLHVPERPTSSRRVRRDPQRPRLLYDLQESPE
jgi:hypothetical protein